MFNIRCFGYTSKTRVVVWG